MLAVLILKSLSTPFRALYAQTLILVGLVLDILLSFLVMTLKVAELRPANLLEFFLYFSPTFLYLPGPVLKALDPNFLAPTCSRTSFFEKRLLNFQRTDHTLHGKHLMEILNLCLAMSRGRSKRKTPKN